MRRRLNLLLRTKKSEETSRHLYAPNSGSVFGLFSDLRLAEKPLVGPQILRFTRGMQSLI